MTAMKRCDEAIIMQNVESVMKRRPQTSYAPIHVRVTAVNPATGEVDFVCKDEVKHTVNWNNVDDVWAACPSTLTALAAMPNPENNGDLPRIGDEGILHLSAAYLDSERSKNRGIISPDPKWPLRRSA
jgi:hypothetical protein